jgi:hypothetical protein
MVAGKVLYDEGKVLTVDESKVISEAIEWAKKISQT